MRSTSKFTYERIKFFSELLLDYNGKKVTINELSRTAETSNRTFYSMVILGFVTKKDGKIFCNYNNLTMSQIQKIAHESNKRNNKWNKRKPVLTGTVFLEDVIKHNPHIVFYDKLTVTELINELRKTEAYVELKKRNIEIQGKQILTFD